MSYKATKMSKFRCSNKQQKLKLVKQLLWYSNPNINMLAHACATKRIPIITTYQTLSRGNFCDKLNKRIKGAIIDLQSCFFTLVSILVICSQGNMM